MLRTYLTIIEGHVHYSGPSCEDAIRTWDRQTYNRETPTTGCITVIEHLDDGTVVRDGNLFHVRENGVVYLSPTIGQEG